MLDTTPSNGPRKCDGINCNHIMKAESSLQCSFCADRFCDTCTRDHLQIKSITAQVKQIIESNNILFRCDSCLSKMKKGCAERKPTATPSASQPQQTPVRAGNVLPVVAQNTSKQEFRAIQQKLDSITSCMNEHQRELTTAVAELAQQQRQRDHSARQRTPAAVVVKTPPPAATPAVQREKQQTRPAAAAVDEINDRQQRYNNIIVANCPMRRSIHLVRDRAESDRCALIEACIECGANVDSISVRRIGKEPRGRPRNVLIKCGSAADKQKLWNCLSNRLSTRNNIVYLRHDLTPQQKQERDQLMTLRWQLKQQPAYARKAVVLRDFAPGVSKIYVKDGNSTFEVPAADISMLSTQAKSSVTADEHETPVFATPAGKRAAHSTSTPATTPNDNEQ